MPLEFTNPLVALVYKPAVDKDRVIHTACYSGLLTNVHECAAERLFSRKSPLIELRSDRDDPNLEVPLIEISPPTIPPDKTPSDRD
jgi:hypothetical protein